MALNVPVYDPRYLAGIVLFNRGDFFEAHEVWESIWLETSAPERRFYQGLIQAAVALCHFGNGNLRGAAKLYHSSRAYMERFASPYLGLDQDAFWKAMEKCFAEVLAASGPADQAPGTPEIYRFAPGSKPATIMLRRELIPHIALDPAPQAWPDPADFLEDEEDDHA